MRNCRNTLWTLAAVLFCASAWIGCTGDEASTGSSLTGDHGAAPPDCTLTQGFWKNHPDKWPVANLKLGSVSYTKVELIAILETPVKGNGLVQLAHQLIAAKLNIAAGAPDSAIKATIHDADTLIGSLVCPPKGAGELEPKKTSSLTDKLDAFNSGAIGPGHCGDNDDEDNDIDEGGGGGSCTCPTPVCGNGKLEAGEACDDGNTANHDGCSSTCEIEVPVCGNGIKEAGEGCDDGNLISGDGCSSTCQCECPHP